MYPTHCIICSKPVRNVGPPGRDDSARYPNIKGGTIEIHFGYGSIFDELDDVRGEEIIHQAIICDECFKEKEDLTRTVRVVRGKTTWEEVTPYYRKKDEEANAEFAGHKRPS